MNPTMSRDALSVAATHVRRQRVIARLDRDIRRREFWRELNPGLSLSDGPVARGAALGEVPAADVTSTFEQVRAEGYCQTPPIIDPGDVARLAEGVRRIADLGLPAVFVFVYDEVYALLARVSHWAAPVLGDGALFLPSEFFAFAVEPGDPSWTRWSAFGPHRDWLGGDPGVLGRGWPTVLNFWIPLVDVTTLDSCIYVVPAPGDPDYFAATKCADWTRFRLQDIRALPAEAGSILAWTTHTAHWGSRSSVSSTTTRISLAAYVQRRDVPPFAEAVDVAGAIPFDDRVRWVFESLTEAGALPHAAVTR